MQSAINKIKNKPILLGYLIIIITTIIACLWYHFLPLSPWLVAVFFWLIILTPGFSLARVFNINFKNDFWGNLILCFTLGFVFSLLVALMGIMLGLTVDALSWLYLGLIVILFLGSLIKDFISKIGEEKKIQLKIKEMFSGDYLIIIGLIGFIILILDVVSLNGSLFRGGDPSFHLSVLRKVIGGQPLSPENLGFIKSAKIHIAYGFPVWHVFVGILTNLLHSNIFTIYEYIATPLTMAAMLVWFWLIRQIFPTRNGAYLAFGLFLVVNFFYAFSVLVLPDSLNQNLLLPLCLGLALKYVFDPQANYKLVGLLSILLILMSAIHLTQYFYFLIIFFVFTLLIILTHFGRENFQLLCKRSLVALCSSLIFLLPFAILMESRGRVFSETLKTFLAVEVSTPLRYGVFARFYILTKFAYLAFPLILIFAKKTPKLLFLTAVFLIVPIAYTDPVKYYLTKILGYIFMNRLYGNVSWYYLIWALVLGFILVLLDYLLIKLPRIIRYIIDLVLLGLVARFIYLDLKSQTLSNFYKNIFNSTTGIWLNNHRYQLLLAVVLTTVAIILLQKKYPKFVQALNFSEPKEKIFNFILMSLIIYFFFSARSYLVTDTYDPQKLALKKFSPQPIVVMAGGPGAIDFINNQLPPKSVFISNGRGVYLAMVSDQHLPAYPHSADENRFNQIFQENLPMSEKLVLIKKGKIEYIQYVKNPKKTFFDQYPQNFQRIYDGQSLIYKVINR